MNLTTLHDAERNIKIKYQHNKIELDDLVKSIEKRISSHRDMIKRHRETISDNLDFSNITKDCIEQICEREAQIYELREFMEVCLGIEL